MTGICTAFALLFIVSVTGTAQEIAAHESRTAIDGFLAAFNTGESTSMKKALAFPFVTYTLDGQIVVSEERERNIITDFARIKEKQSWQRSTFDKVEPVFVLPNKAHYRVTYSRHNTQGKRYATGQIIYIAVKRDGRWAVAARSPIGHKRLD
jgi:hypothetical protein